MNFFMFLYNFFITCFFLIVLPFYFFFNKLFLNNTYILKQRLGIYDNSLIKKVNNYSKIWIHASSVGEVKVACRIIDNLKKKFKNIIFILSTSTVPGNEYAKKIIKDRVLIILAPIDIYFCIRHALLKIRPKIMVYIETEIWPNWINLANNLGIRTIFLNGRISKKSFKRYRKFKCLMKFLLCKVDIFSMASLIDKSRILKIGAPLNRTLLNGNAKFDLIDGYHNNNISERLSKLYGLVDNLPVFLAGSVHSSEEALVIDAYVKVKRYFPDTILIIVPRHTNRVIKVEKLIKLRGFSSVRKTSLDAGFFRKDPIIILDTIGDLMDSYSIATVVFCGGSLVDLGGQNIVEAIFWEKPVIHGPFMDDFKDIVDLLQKYNATIEVDSSQKLAEAVIYLLGHLDYADKIGFLSRKIVAINNGAVERHSRIVGELIENQN